MDRPSESGRSFVITDRTVMPCPHESAALAYTEGGRTKTLTLSEDDVAEVEAALARFQAARAELERAADDGIAALRVRRGR